MTFIGGFLEGNLSSQTKPQFFCSFILWTDENYLIRIRTVQFEEKATLQYQEKIMKHGGQNVKVWGCSVLKNYKGIASENEDLHSGLFQSKSRWITTETA